MTLPSEIRLKIYDHLVHTVAATRNLALKEHVCGYLITRTDTAHHAGAVFSDVMIPKLTVVCKKFSCEYQHHVLSHSRITLYAIQHIPRVLGDLSWHGGAPRPDALKAIRSCDIYVSWRLALGVGQEWQSQSDSWQLNPENHGEWTPTKQVYNDLQKLLANLREVLSDRVNFTFRLELLSEYMYAPTNAHGIFDVDAFVHLLGESESPTNPFSIVLTTISSSHTVLNSPSDYWTRQRLHNQYVTGAPATTHRKVTASEEICFWFAIMTRGRDKKLRKSSWRFSGVYEQDR